MDRPQHKGGTADPIGQRRAIQRDALPCVNLGLPVERQVIGVLGDEDMRHRRLGRQPALDQSRRRGSLYHHFLASPTGILGPAHHEHVQLRRDDVEPFAAILTDPVQRVTAARTSVILNVDHHLDAWQM
jgi:hypothetical protein